MEPDLISGQQRPPASKWKRQFQVIRHFWMDQFPDNDLYQGSLWFDWETRIRDGHEKEEQRITKLAEKWDSRLTCEQKHHLPDDMFADDYWQNCQLTNVMSAALVTLLWSCTECFLKDLVGVCRRALNSNENLSYQFKKIYQFKIIKQSFEREMGINLEQQPNYPIIDAIRILNNSFKHSEGYYLPEKNKPHTQIGKSYLDKWGILDRNDKIDYTKLPFRELVQACNMFFQSLLSAIENNLEELSYEL